MTERSKYDTNPLDPEAAQRANAAFGEDETRNLSYRDTGPQGELAEDAPTRRYEGPAAYPPPLQQTPPNPYQSPPYAPYQTPPGYPYPPAYPPHQAPLAQTPAAPPSTGAPTSRTIAGLNLPENLLLIAPYIPMYIGTIAGLAELFLTPRDEKRVRFHAAQGLALQLAIIVIPMLLGLAMSIGELVGAWTGLVSLVTKLFSVAATIFLVIHICKVWQGKDQPLEAVSSLAAWLNENIAPRNKG